MNIKNVYVKNFRAIREASLDCDMLTVILGRNGAGKSSFLYAIDTFYDVSAPITEEDFFDRDLKSPIEIRVTYGDLRDEEKEEFKSYMQDGKLIVTKRIKNEEGRIVQRYFAAALQIPLLAEVRTKSGKRDRVSAWNDLVEKRMLVDLGEKVKSADDVERLMLEYEKKHPEFMQPIEKEEQFFGPRNIGGGKLDKFTKYVLIPAVREALDEIGGKKGAIYQLLDMLVLRKVNAREDIQKFKLEFEDKVKKLYSSDNLTELPELGESISQTLEKFAPGSTLNLGWGEVKPPEISLPAVRATLIEDKFEGEISRKGHGLQRSLVLTLLQHLATISPEDNSMEDSVKKNVISSKSEVHKPVQCPDLILAIEEPELYLHPSRCRYLAEVLLQLTEKSGKEQENKNQIMYASHSPYFVDLYRFDHVRMIRKVSSPDSATLQSVVTRFSLEQAAQEMAKVCSTDVACFTIDSFRVRAMSVMSTIVNEGFFADVVVVVEGPSEFGVLWKLQEIMKKDWLKLGIVVVPAGGKNNIDRPIVIFRGFSIPVYFIFDADSHLVGKGQKEVEARNRNHRYLRIADSTVIDFPDTQVHENWAVFKQNLEAIFKEALGEDEFLAIQNEVASELGYNDHPERVSKNIEGAACLIERVYEKNKRIPILEQIINKITQLRKKDE
jgi:predicted ATP-dependent endonuclease of OLD family